MQQFIDQNKELVALVIGALVNAILSAVVRYLPTNHWAVQLLRLILQSGNSFGNQTNAITKKAGDVVKVAGVSLMFGLLLLSGCANFQEKINSAIEYESKVQAEAQSLERVAIAAIVLLPPEKQAQAYDDLAKASTAFTQAIAAKSDALQAINAGLSSDWGSLISNIESCAGALEALGKIILSFGASPERVNAAMARVAKSEGFTVARLSR